MTELPDIMRMLLVIFNTLIALYSASRILELFDKSLPKKLASAKPRSSSRANSARAHLPAGATKRAKKSLRSVQKIVAKANPTPAAKPAVKEKPSPSPAPEPKRIPVSSISEPLTFTHLDELEEDQKKAQEKEDDFTKIQGIGPKSEQILKKAGIETYEELAKTTPEKIKSVLVQADHRYAMYEVTYWPRQAKLAAAGDWEKFKQLKKKLGSHHV